MRAPENDDSARNRKIAYLMHKNPESSDRFKAGKKLLGVGGKILPLTFWNGQTSCPLHLLLWNDDACVLTSKLSCLWIQKRGAQNRQQIGTVN